MFYRKLRNQITSDLLNLNKIQLIFGARQVGKTTLIKSILEELGVSHLEVNADQLKFVDILSSRDYTKMATLIGNHEVLFIDEAQNIPEIGLNLKILHDNNPNLKIIATGSSSFELANKTAEPLTGRTRSYKLFPISIQELTSSYSEFEIKEITEELMIYGMYPDVLQTTGTDQKIRNLRELASAYLYKDLIQLAGIRHSDKIHKLLQMLALQIGNLVSLQEIGKALNLSHDTVEHYIDLLEKSFIIFRLSGYSKNMRKEISKMNKIYFYDLGIRNSLIENFNQLSLRQDLGGMWENFLITERVKNKSYLNPFHKPYFWRTYGGAEIDYVEVDAGIPHGYEFKYKAKNRKAPKSWTENYQQSSFQQVHNENYLQFLK